MDIMILASKFYDYSLYFKGYTKDTIRRYSVIIKAYCRSANVERIDQVTAENVRELFFNGRVNRHWSANTFITFHKSLVVFFRWCVQEGYMQSNPADGIDVPKLEKRIPPKLTRQNSLKLLEIVYNYPYGNPFLRCRNHAIFSMFLHAGLRRRELLNLKLTHVDIDNLSVFVKQGKGQKDRIIPMSHTLAQSLKRYLDERKRLKKTCPEFFTSFTHNAGLSDKGLKDMVDKVRKASRLTFTVHQLRHTFATLMLEGGCDIFSLSRMMGHSDITTTTIYLSASAEHLRSQMLKHPLN